MVGVCVSVCLYEKNIERATKGVENRPNHDPGDLKTVGKLDR